MLFAMLMVAAAVAAMLPAHWTRWINGILQPAYWLTMPVSRTTRAVESAGERISRDAPTRRQYDTLRTENARLRRQVHHQQITIAEMNRLLADATGIRDQLVDPDARIIIAPVLGYDASPQRESLTIGKGSRQGVRTGDWVAAGMPLAHQDSGESALLRQWLVGRVSEVQALVSRVQLTTDPAFGPVLAWAAHPTATGRWQLAERECALVGTGHAMMRIDRSPADFRKDGNAFVLIPLAHPRPMALVAGTITDAQMLETGLHYNLDVRPVGDARRLNYVYVISLSHLSSTNGSLP